MSSSPSDQKRRKLLFLTSIYPTSHGTGSQLRAFAMLRMLTSRYDVYLVVINIYQFLPGPHDAQVDAMCREIKYLKVTTQNGLQPTVEAATSIATDGLEISPAECSQVVLQYYQDRAMDVLFLFRLQSLYAVGTTFHRFPHRELDLDEMASLGELTIQRLSEEMSLNIHPPRGWMKGLQTLEKIFIPKFHRVYVSSTVEIERVKQHTGFAKAELLPNIAPSRPFLSEVPRQNPQEILFVGKLDYLPNTDAVLWYLKDIHPLLRRAKGEGIVFRIAGYNCPPPIRAWDGRDGVEVCGYVRDLAEAYGRASLAIVPLRAGSGTRLKILEAFAYGRPVVSTTIGAEGLEVTTGKNLLLADTPETFAGACLEALNQPELAQALIEGGLRINRERYSEEALVRAYDLMVP